MAVEQLILQRKNIVLWEKCEEVKHRIQAESNTAAADKAEARVCVR